MASVFKACFGMTLYLGHISHSQSRRSESTSCLTSALVSQIYVCAKRGFSLILYLTERQMRQGKPTSGERIVKDIKRQTRKQYSAEEKIRIVLDGLRGEESIAELCRKEGIAQGLYYKWSKDFLEAGKKRLAGDIVRQATSTEVTALKAEARDLKEVVAEQTLELRLLKKSMIGDGGDEA